MRSLSLSQVWLQSRPLLARLLVVAVETTHSSYLILQLNCTALSSRALKPTRRDGQRGEGRGRPERTGASRGGPRGAGFGRQRRRLRGACVGRGSASPGAVAKLKVRAGRGPAAAAGLPRSVGLRQPSGPQRCAWVLRARAVPAAGSARAAGIAVRPREARVGVPGVRSVAGCDGVRIGARLPAAGPQRAARGLRFPSAPAAPLCACAPHPAGAARRAPPAGGRSVPSGGHPAAGGQWAPRPAPSLTAAPPPALQRAAAARRGPLAAGARAARCALLPRGALRCALPPPPPHPPPLPPSLRAFSG